MIKIKDATGKESAKYCKWAVCFDIDESNYDDRQDRTTVTAIFNDPWHAEDFIEKCLPEENRERFYLVRM